jgi:hypothetical protein
VKRKEKQSSCHVFRNNLKDSSPRHAPPSHPPPPSLLPEQMSWPLLFAGAIPLAIAAFIIRTWWERRFILKNVPSPVSAVYVLLRPVNLTTTSQANSSLVWGHEKTEFEDNQGWQGRAWFKECGKCFKIKAAWGHPDIVRQNHVPSFSY